MRRTACFALILIIAFSFALVAEAATSATGISGFATVASDGSCQISLTATIHVENTGEKLTFPVPAEASNVTLNGSRARAPKQGQVRQVDLSGITGTMTGDFSINISYTLQDVIRYTDLDTLELQLPLLSGFGYPTQKMDFSVSLPGVPEGRPSFSSGYHQSDIEKDMTYTITGNTISGNFSKALKDHETLTMTLPVTDTMFPQSVLKVQNTDAMSLAMWVCAGLALVYWLLFLRNIPPLWQRSTEPPEGFSAGEVGCILCGQGIHLSMMVLTWAQLGYVLIQTERSGRVLLHKRMEMGNERSETEQRLFKKVFGKRQLADTSGDNYAELCRLCAKRPGSVQELMHPHSGNLQVFRFLVSGIGLFGGISLAMTLFGGAALQGFFMVLFAILGAISAWFIQGWLCCLLLWDRRGLWTGLGSMALWLAIGLIAQQFTTALWTILGLALCGIFLGLGGRRTELGRQSMGQLLDLRRYLRTVSRAELQRICGSDPDYFFRLAPFALALGVHKNFGKQFGTARLPGCPWLTSGMDAHMTALEWAQVIEQAVDAMDARSRQLPLEKFIALIQSFRK